MKNWIERGNFIKQNTPLPDNKITFIPRGDGHCIILSEYAKENFSLKFNVAYGFFIHLRNREMLPLQIANWRYPEYIYERGSNIPQCQYKYDDLVEVSTMSLNRFEIRDALDVFLKFGLVDEELVNRISELIGVNEDENSIYKSCLGLLRENWGSISTFQSHSAIKLAKSADATGHHSIVFKLAEYLRIYYTKIYSDSGRKIKYFDKCNIEGVIDLYKSIDLSNPHYSEAAQRVILMERWRAERLNGPDYTHRFFSENTQQEDQPIQRYHSFSYEPM